MVPFAGWEMPVQYDGRDRRAPRRAQRRAGAFDVSHMGQIETRGPGGARAARSALSSNDVAKLELGGAQYSVLCREDGGVLDDCFTYRLGAERYLTVTNAANHERDLAWFAEHARRRTSRSSTAPRDYAMIAVQGPLAREIVQAIASAPLPRADDGRRAHDQRRRGARRGHRLHGRGRRRAAARPGRRAARSGTRSCAAARTRPGSPRATRCAREVCYPLYGNELSTERGPIEAGLGWCCRAGGGYIGAEAVARRARGRPARAARAVRASSAASRAPGNAVVGGGVVTSGTFSPSLEVGIGMAYLPRRARGVGSRDRDRRARQAPRRARVETRPLVEAC